LIASKTGDRKSLVFQQFVAGRSYSAVFAACSNSQSRFNRSQPSLKQKSTSDVCQLIGCSRQLGGETEFGAAPFSYCGSIGPIALPSEAQSVLKKLGEEIAIEFNIEGVFGIDFILNTEGVWPVDINPRIPASAEIFELARFHSQQVPFSIFRCHIEGCVGNLHPISSSNRQPIELIGKAVLFCRERDGYYVDRPILEQLETHCRDERRTDSLCFADIPNVGASIKFGEPILSIFVTKRTEELVKPALFQAAQRVYSFFNCECSPKKR
jgi:predicted ATP-grasp superfamily ATP-dependent carboligase